MSLRWASFSLAALALIALCARALPAAASVVMAMDLTELVAASDDVVIATAIEAHTHWDDRRRIVTDVTLSVDEPMKGALAVGDTLVVRHLGGAIGELGMRVEGEVGFAVGEQAVIFCHRDGAVSRVVGMSQGALRIARDDRGLEMVMPAGRGLALVRQAADGQLLPAPGYLVTPRALDRVRDEIRDAVEEGGRR